MGCAVMQRALCARGVTVSVSRVPCLLRRSVLLVSPGVTRQSRSPAAVSTLRDDVGRRGVANYPAPQLRNARRKVKKKYNYLTSDRLVKTPRVPKGRDAIRQRDDKALARRQDYRRQLLVDVEEKIHYMEPFVRDYIFFFKLRNRNVQKVFMGHRSLPPLTFLRVYMDILEKLFDPKTRDTLKQLVRETCEAYNGTSIPGDGESNEKQQTSSNGTAGALTLDIPSDEEWATYCDQRTGVLDVGLRYSEWITNTLTRAGLTLGRSMRSSITPVHAYLLLHFGDRTRVPALRDWSHALGPLQPRELVPSSRSHASVLLVFQRARVEIASYGRLEVERAVGAMSFDAQAELIRDVTKRADELLARVRRRRRFETLLALTLNRLPEVRAIQSARSVFFSELEYIRTLQSDGGLVEPSRNCRRLWNSLSAEEQTRYYCFARRRERRTLSGLQLFIRYCAKDYGIKRCEATRIFARMSETQQAALNFPFYYPISPRSGARQAYRKFYTEMCDRFGLINANSSQGNFLFDMAMKRKWDSLSAAEQECYFDKEDIASVFPLLPTSEAIATTATLTTSAVHDTQDGSAALLSSGAEEEKSFDEGDADDDVADRAQQAVQDLSMTRRSRRTEARSSSTATTSATKFDDRDTVSVSVDMTQQEEASAAAASPSSPLLSAAQAKGRVAEEHIAVTRSRRVAEPEQPSLILSTSISPDTTLHIL